MTTFLHGEPGRHHWHEIAPGADIFQDEYGAAMFPVVELSQDFSVRLYVPVELRTQTTTIYRCKFMSTFMATVFMAGFRACPFDETLTFSGDAYGSIVYVDDAVITCSNGPGAGGVYIGSYDFDISDAIAPTTSHVIINIRRQDYLEEEDPIYYVGGVTTVEVTP
jgi:hypothetical protein